jgi:hypothetical protein
LTDFKIREDGAVTAAAQGGAVTTTAVLPVRGKQYSIRKSDDSEQGIMGIGGPNQPLAPFLNKAERNDKNDTGGSLDADRDDEKHGVAHAQSRAVLSDNADRAAGGADRRAGGADVVRFMPVDIKLEAGGSRAAKRWGGFLVGLAGAIGGGIAGFLAGSAVPVIGNVTGLLAGAVMGGYGAVGGGLFGTGLGAVRNWLRGGQGQQAHLDQARASLTAQGVTLTTQERDNLEALTPDEWRMCLHMPAGMKEAFRSKRDRMTGAADRQTYREAVVLKVARDGKDAAIRFRKDLLGKPAPDQRREMARGAIQDLGGHPKISQAHYAGDSNRAASLRAAQRQEEIDRAASLRQQQEINRVAWNALGDQLANRFGASLQAEFLREYRDAIRNGDPLLSDTQQRWIGIGQHQAAVNDLLARIGKHSGLAPDAVDAVATWASTQRTLFVAEQSMPSLTLRRTGRLGQHEVRDLLEAACATQKALKQEKPNVADPPDLDTLVADEKLGIEVERALLSTDGRLEVEDRWPADLFSGSGGPAGQVYGLCATLDDMDAAHTKALYRTGDPDVDQDRAARLDQAKGLATLGLALKAAEVPEAEAAEMLRMELAERMAGRGHKQLDQWSPELPELDKVKWRAGERLKLRTQRCAALKAALGQAERARATNLRADQGFLSAMIDQLALHGGEARLAELWGEDGTAVKAMIEASVTPRSLLHLLGRGAQDVEEAISCDRLGVEPEDLAGLDPQVQQEWQDQGFNRVEALAYRDQIHAKGFPGSKLGPDDEELKPFRGSHLTPAQIQRYVGLAVTYNKYTAPRYCLDRNRVSELQEAGEGKLNTVHKATYRTPFGPQERYLKKVKDGEGKVLRSNIAMSLLDRELDRELDQVRGQEPGTTHVIVDSEAGFVGDDLVISMEAAGGASAGKQMHSNVWAVVDPNGPLRGLYDRDSITSQDQRGRKVREQARERYGLAALRVNQDGNLEFMTSVMQRLRTDGDFQKQSVWLQLVDYLGDMKDRHNNNYHVKVDRQARNLRFEGLLAIDNDDGFGGQNLRVQSVGIAPVIDTEQRAAFLRLYQNLDNTASGSEVDEKGADGDQAPQGAESIVDKVRMVIEDVNQVASFEARLRMLHRHVNESLHVSRLDQWGSEDVTRRLMQGSSLVQRDTQPV